MIWGSGSQNLSQVTDVVNDMHWISRFPLECTYPIGQVDSPVICDLRHVIDVTLAMVNRPGWGGVLVGIGIGNGWPY